MSTIASKGTYPDPVMFEDGAGGGVFLLLFWPGDGWRCLQLTMIPISGLAPRSIHARDITDAAFPSPPHFDRTKVPIPAPADVEVSYTVERRGDRFAIVRREVQVSTNVKDLQAMVATRDGAIDRLLKELDGLAARLKAAEDAAKAKGGAS